MLTVGDTFRAFALTAVKGGPQGLKIDTPSTEISLWSLAVVAINGCGRCMQSFEDAVRQHDLTAEQVRAAVRMAAVVHAVTRTLDAERGTASQGVPQEHPL